MMRFPLLTRRGSDAPPNPGCGAFSVAGWAPPRVAVQRRLEALRGDGLSKWAAAFSLVFSLALGLALPARLDGQQPGPEVLSLDTVVERALGSNPGFQAQRERLVEVGGGITEAKADALPQISLRSGWNSSRNPSLLNSADFQDIIDQFPGGSFEPQRQTLYEVGADLTQPLFTWGKVGAALDLARSAVEITEAQIGTAQLDLAAEAAESYYRLLAARRALETLEIQGRLRTEVLAAVEARFELGDATRLDLLRARSGVAEVAPLVASTRGDVAVAESRLRRALGLEPGSTLEVRSDDRELAPVPSLDALLELAERRRPELADLALQGEALGHRVRVTRAEGRPQLELNGAYGRTARLPENLDDPLFRDWRISIDLRWELFDGGRRKGQVAQLESQRRQLSWQREELQNGVRLEVEEALAGYGAARARWQAAGAAADVAREASWVARESYDLGVALQTEWLEAQRDETTAELELVQAYYDACIEWTRMQRALGLLPSAAWSPPLDGGEGAS